MPLCTDTMLSFYLWAISHGEWAVFCCDVCCSFVCYCSDRRHAKSHLWWPGVAVSNPGMVCSLQKLSSLIWAILAASTAIKKCGLCRDRQNLCAFEVPKSSYAMNCKPVHSQGYKEEKGVCIVYTGEAVVTTQHSPSAWLVYTCLWALGLISWDFLLRRMPNGAISKFPSCFRDEFIQMHVNSFQFCSLFLRRQTFPVFFRVMMAQLESSVKSIPAGKPSDSGEVGKQMHWNHRGEKDLS